MPKDPEEEYEAEDFDSEPDLLPVLAPFHVRIIAVQKNCILSRAFLKNYHLAMSITSFALLG